MQNKTHLSFTIPKQLQSDLRKRVLEDGLGLRGKSKWVEIAINELCNMKDFAEKVNLGDELSNLNCTESVVVGTGTKKVIDDAILTIRKQYPLLEGVQSKIIRTSIIQKVLRS